MSFTVIFSPKSYRKIRSFDSELKERIQKAVREISSDPWVKGTIKVKGYDDVRRKEWETSD